MRANSLRCCNEMGTVFRTPMWISALAIAVCACATNSETPPSPWGMDDDVDGGGGDYPRDDPDTQISDDTEIVDTDSDDGATDTDEEDDGNETADTDTEADESTDSGDTDTESPPGVTLSFLVMGDLHGGRDISTQKKVAAAMDDVAAQYAPVLAISAGDITDHGLKGDAASFFETYYVDVYRNLPNLDQVPFYGVLGNHDYCGPVDALMDYTENGWRLDDHVWKHELTVGDIDIAFVHVDTSVLAYYYRMEDWLVSSCPAMQTQFDTKYDDFGFEPQLIIDRARALLDEVSDYEYLFVVGHHPIGGGPCGAEGELGKLRNLVGDFHVTAYFSGHVHVMDFGRDSSTLFVTTGTSGTRGGSGCLEKDGWKNGLWQAAETGFVLATIADDTLKIRFINESGDILIVESTESRAATDDAADLPECADQAPDNRFTCEEQNQFGKCGENWMVGFCCATCFNCSNECLGL